MYFQWLYLILLKVSAASPPLSEDHNVMKEYSTGVIVNMLQIRVKPAVANLKIDPLPDTEQMSKCLIHYVVHTLKQIIGLFHNVLI